MLRKKDDVQILCLGRRMPLTLLQSSGGKIVTVLPEAECVHQSLQAYLWGRAFLSEMPHTPSRHPQP